MLKYDDGMIPDLDFPAKQSRPRPTVTRHIPITRPPRVSTPLIIALAILAVIAAAYTAGRVTATSEMRPLIDRAMAEAETMAATAAQARDAATYWRAATQEATSTIEALRSDAASATAEYESLKIQVDDLEQLNAALKREIERKAVPQKAPAPKAPAVQQTSTGAWSRDRVAATLTAAAAKYGLDDEQTAWIVDTGVRVAYRESRYQPAVVNASGHAGLFQFSSAWGGDERLDPVWSCYRFVRVYAEGGEAKIRQHWKATV